jgi:ankyrin repeat protein
VVAALLANPDTDVNYVNDKKSTALAEAIHLCHPNIAKLLLSVPDINVNAVHPHARSPLYWAIEFGYHSLARRLLSHKDIVIDYKKLPDKAEEFFKSLKVELTCE